jgi:hypothetical protein
LGTPNTDADTLTRMVIATRDTPDALEAAIVATVYPEKRISLDSMLPRILEFVGARGANQVE